jgi:hypothetical protein
VGLPDSQLESITLHNVHFAAARAGKIEHVKDLVWQEVKIQGSETPLLFNNVGGDGLWEKK